MLKSARSTRLSTHNPRQRDRQAGPSGSPGPTGQPTGGRGWPCPAGFSPAVRSPAVWLLPTDSTRGGAPAGATCAARGPLERGDRRSWRAVALQGGGAGLFRRNGGRSGDFGSRPSFAIARRARCARKEEERKAEQGWPRRRARRPSSGERQREGKRKAGPHLRSIREASGSTAWRARWRCLWREKVVKGAVAGVERGGKRRGGVELRRGSCCLLRIGGSERNGVSGEKRGAGGRLGEARAVGPAGAPPGGRRRRTVATWWPLPERGRGTARGVREGGRARPGRLANWAEK